MRMGPGQRVGLQGEAIQGCRPIGGLHRGRRGGRGGAPMGWAFRCRLLM